MNDAAEHTVTASGEVEARGPASDGVEEIAGRIAARGRDALVARLRPAFEEAASAHSDLVAIDRDRLERMVQTAADRADGLQWRRALAGVASEELGIGLGEALAHPAVARAQELVGARPEEDAVAEIEAAEVEEVEAEIEAAGVEAAEVEAESPARAPAAAPAASRRLVLPATHLFGVPALGEREENLQLRIGDGGVEIARDDAVVARIRWNEVQAVDVPVLRQRLLRRRGVDARLTFLRAAGEASFEIPGITPDELDEQISPIIAARR